MSQHSPRLLHMNNRMKLPMNSLLFYKSYVGAAFLFLFLFSANVLFYSDHFIAEIGHARPVTSASKFTCVHDSSPSPDGQHQHDGGPGSTHHGDHASCCDSHSHLSIMYLPVGYQHSPHIVSLRNIEPFRFIPEVFLDTFIPPAELA